MSSISLTERLSKAFSNILKRGKLTDANMQETLKEIKKALIEADVAVSIVKEFVDEVGKEATGREITKSLSPAQMLVKLVNEKLVTLMGEYSEELNLATQPPAVILMSGLQGSGKTTTSAKLAKWLIERKSKSVMLASADVYRPAAIEQLRTLARDLNTPFFETDATDPKEIAKGALAQARRQQIDVLILDTAGRLHIDEKMMDEIKALHQLTEPVETLFVVDGMMGQDAVNTAKVFNQVLPLTGVIVSKLDGDARAGAVLSIRKVTGKPIKFIGMGEKVDALEAFHPDRMASRILGMGDVLTLVEELEQKLDKQEAERLAKKMAKGQGFDLEDFRVQIEQMKKMGGMSSLMTKLPGMDSLPPELKAKVQGDKSMDKMLIIISSMTMKERHNPQLVRNSGSRKRRISLGSGTSIQDINQVLKQHEQMHKMMTQKGGILGMMRGIKGLQGMIPGGFGGM